MRKLTSLLLSVVVITLCSQFVFADDRAQEILKQARAAIGEEALQKLQSLSINGQYRRMLGERQLAGDREVSILLPDKYLVEDAFNPGGLSTAMITTKGLNGEHAWNASSGGGGGMIFRMGGPGGQQSTPEQMEAMFRRQFQIELTRYLLALVAISPPSFALEYKYAGESDVDDAHVDVLDATGPDKFSIRIYFDKLTHLPLLLSYRSVKPRIVTMTRSAGAKPEDAIKKAREDAEKNMAAESGAQPEEVDFFIRLSDHKKVNGLLLPHKLTFLTEGEVSEEFEVSKYQVNPQFKTDKFQKH